MAEGTAVRRCGEALKRLLSKPDLGHFRSSVAKINIDISGILKAGDGLSRIHALESTRCRLASTDRPAELGRYLYSITNRRAFV